jgi:pentatricopeptide repeat protein
MEHEHPVEAFNCLEEMQSKGIQSDATTSLYFLKACGSLEWIQKGQAKHIGIVKQGLEGEPLISNSLVDMYAKCGHLREAQELSRCTRGHNVVLCCTLLAAYVDHGYAEEALECLNQMGMSKNTVTYICVLKACSAIGTIDMGRVMHSEIIKAGVEDASLCRSGNKLCNKTEPVNPQVEAVDIALENALIDMYSKCGSLPDAYNLAAMAPFADTVSWNVIITGYARQGQSGSVFCVLDKMIRKGVEPDQVTFLGVLSACSHDGLVDVIHSYFKAMESSHGSIRPGIPHFNCMLDAFARSGQFNEAVLLMRNMPHQPNLSSWCCMLGACCKWGNLELGRHAFECASKLTKCDVSLFIVMANIYWDAHTSEQSQTIELILLQSSTVLEHG